MCNGTRVHRGGKRGEVVVQRGTTFLDDLLDGLVLEHVLVEQHVDVVVPGQGVTRLLFLLLIEWKLALLLNISIITSSELKFDLR